MLEEPKVAESIEVLEGLRPAYEVGLQEGDSNGFSISNPMHQPLQNRKCRLIMEFS